jgi:lipid-A-disaccharide synthase-like uncharacterized protein
MDWSDTWYWLVLGILGQASFASRFLVQWIASERARDSVVPVAFWWISLVGSLVMAVYTWHRQEPVLFAGFVFNGVVYLRNLALIRRKQPPARGVAEARPAPHLAEAREEPA